MVLRSTPHPLLELVSRPSACLVACVTWHLHILQHPGSIICAMLHPTVLTATSHVSVGVQGELDPMPAVDSAMSYSPATSSIMASMDEDEMTTEAKQCLQALKEGKRCRAQLPICMLSVLSGA